MSEKIELPGSERNIVTIWLIEAITEASGRDLMATFFPNKPDGEPCVAEVVMTVNGVEVPFTKVAEGFWRRAEEAHDADVLEKAKQLVTEAGLEKVMQALRDAEWKITDALENAVRK